MKTVKRFCAFALVFVMLAGLLPTALRIEAAAAGSDDVDISPEVARAYGELIQAEYDAGKYNVRVFLFDGGGEAPMIWIASGNGGDENYIEYDYNDRVYTWQNGAVQECKWISSVLKEGENGVVTQENINMVSDNVTDYKFFRLSGGKIADEPFATGMYGINGVIYNGKNYGEVSTFSHSEYYALADQDAELIAGATSGLSDQLNLTGDWIRGYDVLAKFEAIILADNIAKMDPAMRKAYRGIVQKAVDQLGVYIRPVEFYSYEDVEAGVAGVHLVDVTNDGKEELFLYTTDDDGMMQVVIYSFDSGSCKAILAEDVGMHFNVCEADNGQRYLLAGYTRHSYFPYLWNGSEFYAPELSDAQWAEVEKAAMESGMQGEGAMRYELGMKNLGLTDADNNSLCYASIDFGPDVSGDLLATLAALGVIVKIDPTDFLGGVPYVGDYSRCKLTAGMALGYADAIESLRGTEYEPRYALLVDLAEDGWPILITLSERSIYGMTIWHIVDGKVVQYDYEQDLKETSVLYLSVYNDKLGLAANMIAKSDFDDSARVFYTCKNGKLTLTHTLYEQADVESLGSDEYSVEYNYFLDGKQVDAERYWNDYGCFYDDIGLVTEWEMDYLFGDAYIVVNVMRSYAQACNSGYSFPEAEAVDEASVVEAIAKAVAKAVGGEIEGIYKLDEGIYYVIIVVDGSRKGALVQGSRENGKLSWNVTETHDSPLSNDELREKLHALQSVSNIVLDFSALQSGDGKNTAAQLESALANMPGAAPNDLAKAEIADYIGLAISSACTITLSGSDNRFLPDAEAVTAIRKEAEKARAEYEELLEKYGVTLNKPITVIIRIVWKNMDAAVPCQITLGSELLDALNGCDAQILLGDIRHYVHVRTENLRALLESYGSVDIQLVREAEGKYSINFLNAQGAIIDRLDSPIGFALPADDALTTIMVSYTGGSMNWGGQFDAAAKCLSFDASYSGHYELLTNAVEIADISDLDEELRAAIAFLVSKGYMSLDNGSFLPDEQLNRYQFAQALVGMFFALDQELTTGFTDVPADSPYYSYVASGESLDVIKGYDECTFGGEDGITNEQMLALAARTLVQYKGYAEPAVPYDYLSSFADGYDVSDWAQSQVALAIREGLVDRGGELRPTETVTRSEAALILYRLFLLLHEVPVVALELPESATNPDVQTPGSDEAVGEDGKSGSAGTVIAIVICVVVLGGGAGWFLLRKKSKS